MSDWRPIETAPKDGSKLLLAIADDGSAVEELAETGRLGVYEITAGFWSFIDSHAGEPRHGWCDWTRGLDDDDYWAEFKPTHWMPLPAPPSPSGDQK